MGWMPKGVAWNIFVSLQLMVQLFYEFCCDGSRGLSKRNFQYVKEYRFENYSHINHLKYSQKPSTHVSTCAFLGDCLRHFWLSLASTRVWMNLVIEINQNSFLSTITHKLASHRRSRVFANYFIPSVKQSLPLPVFHSVGTWYSDVVSVESKIRLLLHEKVFSICKLHWTVTSIVSKGSLQF
jgi:hypothetical protein